MLPCGHAHSQKQALGSTGSEALPCCSTTPQHNNHVLHLHLHPVFMAPCLQACPEQQLCRLLAKLTKGCAPGSQDLAALAANAHLVAVLVRCCSPADRKTCKRALQVGGRMWRLPQGSCVCRCIMQRWSGGGCTVMCAAALTVKVNGLVLIFFKTAKCRLDTA